MIHSDSPRLKSIEQMMTSTPGFHPKGGGILVYRRFEYTAKMCDCRYCLHYSRNRECTVDHCPYVKERIIAGVASRPEVMTETMKNVRSAAFRIRLNQSIIESEGLPMNFKNEKHRKAFDEAIRKLDRKNYPLMSAVYLLTADHNLWIQLRHCVERNEIRIDSFKLKNSTENGYTLLCCAKDLYLGTKHMTIGDLADLEIISPKMFSLICNAMAIRRFGLGAIQYINNERNSQV